MPIFKSIGSGIMEIWHSQNCHFAPTHVSPLQQCTHYRVTLWCVMAIYRCGQRHIVSVISSDKYLLFSSHVVYMFFCVHHKVTSTVSV